MRKEGTIVRWDDVRGFGFIRSTSIGQDVFLHARDFRAAGGAVPRQGLRVTFDDVHVGGKGPRAVAARPVTAAAAAAPAAPATAGRSSGGRRKPEHRLAQAPRRRAADAPSSGAALALPLMLAYAAALLWAVWQRHLPGWILGACFGVNLLAFFAYWQDKWAAQQRAWRVKEDTLHFWSLAGGWGGAWFAQQILRHKSSKASFRAGYWATVAMHCAAVFGAGWFLFLRPM